jgi:hypothetical protein
MKRRILLWTLIGFAVACSWVLYGLGPGNGLNLGRWTIVAITAPASLLGRSVPLTYYWVVLLNGAIYALVGLAIEPWLRHHRRPASSRAFDS